MQKGKGNASKKNLVQINKELLKLSLYNIYEENEIICNF
jgi:hypothetical protein